MKKISSETPASAMPIAARSKAEPRRSADSTPIAVPATSHITAAPNASDAVTGTLLISIGHTGCWLRNE